MKITTESAAQAAFESVRNGRKLNSSVWTECQRYQISEPETVREVFRQVEAKLKLAQITVELPKEYVISIGSETSAFDRHVYGLSGVKLAR